MSKACQACTHHERDSIDQKIIAGASLRSVSALTGISTTSLHRHKGHIKQALSDARARESEEHGSKLLIRVEKLIADAEKILASATSKEDLRAATGAVAALTRLLELIGRLSGELANPNAPGIHLTLNSRTTNTTINNNFNDDLEFAEMIGEATAGFSVDELMRLKAIAEGQPTLEVRLPTGRSITSE